MSSPTVLVIILNYKTADMTLRAVDAARAAMTTISGEILVVDNNSQDNSFETISAHITSEGWGEDSQVRVVQAGHNGGFGAGNNFGVQTGLSNGTAPDFYYVLNSDAFPAPNAIQELLDHLVQTPSCGFAGSYLHGPERDTHLSTFRFPSIFSEFEGAIRFGPVSRLLANHKVPVETPSTTQSVQWLAGASIMMRAKVLEEIGLFDETFFLYFEETDLCRRANLAGYSIDFVRSSEVTHIGSVSTGMNNWTRVPGYWFDSRFHYFRKNHGLFYAVVALLAHLAGGFLFWLRCLITRKERDVPRRFLTTLLLHDLRAVTRSMFKSRQSQAPASVSQIQE